MDKRHKLSRRQFIHLSALTMGSAVLAACGGNTSNTQPNAASTQGNSKATTPATQGGSNAGTATPPPSSGAMTAPVASPASTSSTTKAVSPASGTTQAPVPTVSAKNFNEAPQLQKIVKSGKLPKVADRMPKTPMVLKPVEKVGTYGGDWNTVLLPSGDGAWLTRTNDYDYLVRWKPVVKAFAADEVIPNIAESYEVGENGKEYTFKLREGMRWSDGKPFTADDIVFWYKDVYSNKDLTPTQPSWLNAGDKPMKVVKQDDHTVSFRFAVSNGLLLQNMATPSGDIFTRYPAHYMKQFHKQYNENVVQEAKKQKLEGWTDLFFQMADQTANPKKPVLTAWVYTKPYGGNTSQFIAERNPYYWKVDTKGNQLPYLDRIVYRIVSKPDTMVLMGLNGELDMQDRHINDLSNKAVFYKNQKKGNYHFFTDLTTQMNTVTIQLNLTAKNERLRKVFQDKNFRIGLSHAINRQDIIDTVYVSQGEPYQAAPRPESPFYNQKLAKQYTEYDPKQANQYLDKALPKKDSQGRRLGTDGKPFSFTVEVASDFDPQFVDVMNIVKKYRAQVGITIDVKAENRDIWTTRVDEGNLHDATVWQGGGGLEVLIYPYYYFPWKVGSRYAIPWGNWYKLGGTQGQIPKDPGMPVEAPPPAARKQMQLYDQIKTTADSNEQAKLMKEILDIAQEQFWCMGISLSINGYGIVKNTFDNVPKEMVFSWLYPNPAPTNPPQYWTEEK